MGEVKEFPIKGQDDAESMLKGILARYRGKLNGVLLVALLPDGEVLDAWSSECHNDIYNALGGLEQLKMDFWYTLFSRRQP